MTSPELAITVPETIVIEDKKNLAENLTTAIEEMLDYAGNHNIEPSQISLICDLDGVVRRSGQGLPGRLSTECIEVLHTVKKRGIHIAGFITNQPEGQQAAKILYGETMFERLLKEFPDAWISNAGWQFMWHQAKKQPETVQDARDSINKLPENQRLIVMFGDKTTDEQFFADAITTIPDRQFLFVKFPVLWPDAPYIVRKLLDTLIP